MKKQLLILGMALAGLTVQAQEAQLATLKVTSGFNADVVVEALPVADHLVQGIDNATTGFYMRGLFVPNDCGLGLEMPLISNHQNAYYFPYEGNNAFKFTENGQSTTFKFEEPITASTVWVLGISANGASSLDVVFNYADGQSSDPQRITYGDWWNSNYKDFEAFSKLDRINPSSGNPQGVDQVHLDEYEVATGVSVGANNPVTSITVTRISGGIPSVLGFSADYAPVVVTEGYNNDIIAEKYPIGDAVTAGIDEQGWVLMTKAVGSVTLNDGGLAEDGMITSKKGITYRMDYTGLNAARLAGESRTAYLEIAGAPKCEKLYFLGACGNGPQNIQVTVQYEDQSTSEGSFTLKDWYRDRAEGDEAVYGLGRFYNGGADLRYGFRLYEGEVEADPTKGVVAVTLTATGGTPVVMGVSALASPEGLSPFVGAPVAEGEYYLYNVESGLWLQNNNMEKAPADWTTRAQVDVDGLPFGLVAETDASGLTSYRINPFFAGNHSVNGHNLYMDTGDAVTMWSFEPAEESAANNAYRIVSGNYRLGVDENGFISNNISGTWQLITKEERMAQLAKATADNPSDLSWLIEANSFPANYDRNGSWKREGDAGGFAIGGDWDGNKNRVLETWGLTKADIYQELTVPNGCYQLQAAGAFSPTGNDGVNAERLGQYLNGTLENYGWFYANTEKVQMPSFYSVQFDEKYQDRANRELNVDGTTYWIADGVNQICRNITDGRFKSDVVTVNVFDGKLRVGAKVEDAEHGANWIIIDNFRLTYLGPEYDNALIEKAEAELQGLVDEGNNMLTAEEGGTTAMKENLRNALETANTAIESKDPAAMAAATDKLGKAEKEIKASVLDLALLKATLALTTDEESTIADFDIANEEGMNMVDNAETADQVTKALSKVRKARKLNAVEKQENVFAGAEPEDQGVYYLYNVGTSQFFQGGSSWGAHAAVGQPGIPVTLEAKGEGFRINTNLENGIGQKYLNNTGYCDTGWDGAWTFKPVAEEAPAKGMNKTDEPTLQKHTFNIVQVGREDAGLGFDPDSNTDTGYDYFDTVNSNFTDLTNPKAQWVLVTKEERDKLLDDASFENPVDATYLIGMPGFNQRERISRDGNNEVLAWTWTNGGIEGRVDAGNTTNHSNFAFAAKGVVFDLTQEIENLRPGIYNVKAQGFYRPGSIDETVAKIKNGEEVSVPAVLMLQGEAEVAPAKGDEGEDDGIVKATNTIIFPSISDALDKAPGMGVSTEVGELPGDVFSGVNFMENGLYEVEGKVKVDQMGKLTITVKKDEVLYDDLFVVDNFRLLYLGEKDPSGVRGVLVDEGEAAADGKIFTVDGVQVKSANKPGLYIKNGKKFVVK